jgi:pyridoxamine 5'-phosphate oxidase
MKSIRHQISKLRNDYDGEVLDEKSVDKNPVHQFRKWMEDALDKQVPEANAMILATADKLGKPSVRTVLLRDFSERGFVFYTNYNSRKGKEIEENPQGSMLFFWPVLQRQVRIDGRLEKTDPASSELYFKSRPQGNQVAAWISPQSAEIESKYFLEENYKSFEKKFQNKPIPYPEFWGGYCLKPERFEFWQGQLNRLHDRIQYSLEGNDEWKIVRLAP